MSTIERIQTERTIPLDLSHLPPHVIEDESNMIPALTGAVILGVIDQYKLERQPLEGYSGSWIEFMPGSLVDSIPARDQIRILRQSQERLKDYSLGSHEDHRQDVEANLDLLLRQYKPRFGAVSETRATDDELSAYRNHGNGD